MPACLSITNQRETVVVFDRATGRPLAQRHRLAVPSRRPHLPAPRRATDTGPWSGSKTGLKIDTYFSASKLAWLVRERPDLAARLADGEALIGTIDTYLIYRLTGGKVFATDHTNASRTLLFDIRRLCWDEALCDLFDVPMRALPEVRESAAQFGATDVEGALPEAGADPRGHGRFAGVVVRPALLPARHGEGHVRLRHVGVAEHRRLLPSRGRWRGDGARLGASTAGPLTRSKASSIIPRRRWNGSRINSA